MNDKVLIHKYDGKWRVDITKDGTTLTLTEKELKTILRLLKESK